MRYIDFGVQMIRAARRYGDREALLVDGVRLTYRQIDERSTRFANGLLGLGLRPGDRVATLLFNGYPFVEAFFAMAKAGLVIVPVNRRLSDPEIVHILNDCQVSGLIYDAEFAASADAIRRETPSLRHLVTVSTGATPEESPRTGAVAGSVFYHDLLLNASAREPGIPVEDTDVQAIYYTTGTTGTPKGVVRTYQNNLFMALGSLAVAPMAAGDTWLYTLPLTSGASYGLSFCAWLVGGRVIMQRTFDAERIPRLIQEERVTHAIAVPTMWELILSVPGHDRYDLSSLRFAQWGGMPIQTATVERLRQWLPVPCGGAYGLTEAGCITWCVGEAAARHPDACGKPVPLTEVRVVDPEDRPLPPGQMGEVQVQSPIVMKEYYNKPDVTAEALRGGWFRTGDLGYLDEEGNLYVVDRIKDMIISGGENIYPAEVENVLSTMPGIAEVAVVGVPDPVWGQSVCAYVVPKPGAQLTAEAVVAHCAGRLARFKRPRHVEFVDAIPKNQMGKFEKPALVRRWVERHQRPAGS